MTSREITGEYKKPSKPIAIVAARFNDLIVDRLISGAQDVLQRHGMKLEDIDIVRVPGAFEIPLVSQQLAKNNRYAGIIALGVVIRGETAHFDYVAGGCANGLMQAQLQSQVPIMFGVLTTENVEQAMARAGSKAGNKGSDCAMALLEMIDLLGKIHE